MANLNELATKLQEFIIRSQSDAHNGRNFSKSRYNNLKLKISSTLEYPNIIVSIGISEATYNNMLENMHLMGHKPNYDWLMESKNQLETGKAHLHELLEASEDE